VADVFMSYVREDRTIAERVSRALQAAGLTVWWDRHIRAGADFAAEIDRELSAARIVIVLWSAASQASQWVRDEASQARDENKLIPVRIDGAQPPLGFRQVQALDFRGWDGDPSAGAFTDLLAAVRHYVGGASVMPPQPVPLPAATPSSRRSSMRWLGLGAVVIAAGVAAFFALRPHPATPGDNDGRIAIGTFEPIAKSEDVERFAKGVTDTVIRVFANNGIKGVTGARAGTDAGARSGPAEFVLRGTADRDGDEFVVSADIVHNRDGVVLWSTTMRRDAAQPRRLQDQFSMSVAGVLSCALRLRSDAKNDPSPDLFGALLGICAAFGGSIEQTPELARRIVQMAPQYAMSYALRAGANAATSNSFGKTPEEVARLHKMVYDDAKLAEEMDPTVDSYLVRATVHDPAVGLAERERLLLKSLALNPGSGYVLREYGEFLESVGRIHEALDHYERAVSIDLPGSGNAILRSAFVAAGGGNIEYARKRFEDARATALPDREIDWLRFWVEYWFGDGSIAKNLGEDSSAFFVGTYQVTTLPDRCTAVFIDARIRSVHLTEAEIAAACPGGNPGIYTYFGYVDTALRQWEPVIADSGPSDPSGGVDLLFASFGHPVRADPRFMHLAAREGLVDYWLDTDQWPDFCKEEKLPYDCKETALAARAQVNAERAGG